MRGEIPQREAQGQTGQAYLQHDGSIPLACNGLYSAVGLLGTAASQYSCSIPLTCNGLHSVVGLLGTAASQYSCSTREPASGCLAAKSRRRLRSALGGGGSSQAGQCGGFRSS